uniref:Uncharacterized protein n=1 Tax=Arion vulgaris TaxID=1028688 RepID=A0A0B6YTV5_9EUPU
MMDQVSTRPIQPFSRLHMPSWLSKKDVYSYKDISVRWYFVLVSATNHVILKKV